MAISRGKLTKFASQELYKPQVINRDVKKQHDCKELQIHQFMILAGFHFWQEGTPSFIIRENFTLVEHLTKKEEFSLITGSNLRQHCNPATCVTQMRMRILVKSSPEPTIYSKNN